MGKRKAAKPSTVSFQVRFDADLHSRLKEDAEKAGISLNQLVQGICRAVSEYLHQGEAVKTPSGFVKVNDVRGCLFAGRPGWSISKPEADEVEARTGERPAEGTDDGFVWFGLDFTNRGFVRFQQ